MNRPVLYLNKSTQNEQSLIRLLYKPNSAITELIKRNDWIKFNSVLGSYCVNNDEKNIKLVKDLFDGLAIVNTYYLEAVPKIKADEIVLNKDIIFNNVLPVRKKKGSILLIPVKEGESKIILIKYSPNPEIKKLIKARSYIIWYGAKKSYGFNARLSLLKKFINDVEAEVRISIHHMLMIIILPYPKVSDIHLLRSINRLMPLTFTTKK